MQVQLISRKRSMQKMFSSTNNNNNNINIINPFAHLPSSSYHPPLVMTQDSSSYDNIILHHHHDLQLPPTSFMLPPDSTLINMALLNNAAAMSYKQDDGDYSFGASSGLANISIPAAKKPHPVKKDRHRKIRTAQGVRDRRVRLSIGIARQFFDLQDMLGYDKASKTLEWLLTKSKKAIQELVKMKHGNGNSSKRGQSFSWSYYSSSDECGEMEAAEKGELDGGELEGTAFKSGNSIEENHVVSKEKNSKKLHKATVHLLAKESRAKARARARERTREKMCTRTCTTTTHDEWKIRCPDTGPQFLNQLRSLTQLEASKKYLDHSYDHNMAASFTVVAHQVEEPSPARKLTISSPPTSNIVLKRKLKPSTILGSHQNLSASKDVISCSTSGNNYFPNIPQNWGINGATTHSTFCAIANVNLSTGVQTYGKP